MKSNPRSITNLQNGPIMDVLDTWLFSTLNLNGRIALVIEMIRKRNLSHRFKMFKIDKYDGCGMSFETMKKLLSDRGVLTFGYTHDASFIYFSVSKKQSQWAEYILLRSGIGDQLQNPTSEYGKNLKWASGHTSASPAWKHQGKSSKFDKAEDLLDFYTGYNGR